VFSYLSADDLIKIKEDYLHTSRVQASQQPDLGNSSLNFLSRYPFLLKCNSNYTVPWSTSPTGFQNNKNAGSHMLRIVRGILVYYPVDRSSSYEPEFKWFYQSWLEMLKSEPAKWRTDLLVFIDDKPNDDIKTFFVQYNCTFDNVRSTSQDMPLCRLIAYKPLKDRTFGTFDDTKLVDDNYVKRFIDNVDIFDDKSSQLNLFKFNLKSSLANYPYVDSILIAFEAFNILRDTYTFLVRSDMDVFLTPLFATWLPTKCNDFYTGRGGYSHKFNTKRLNRIAKNLNLANSNIENLGSTWYSTPEQFRLVSYMTLFSMLYLSNEEFSTPQKDYNKVFLWPFWHYGVLLLYGQSLAMNHLIATKQLNIINSPNMLDVSTTSNTSVHSALHLHVFQGFYFLIFNFLKFFPIVFLFFFNNVHF
jgi:hypothetical protein